MIHPTKSDRGRHVTYRCYHRDEASQITVGETIAGKILNFDRMLVAVVFPEFAGVPQFVNRVDLEWVG